MPRIVGKGQDVWQLLVVVPFVVCLMFCVVTSCGVSAICGLMLYSSLSGMEVLMHTDCSL